MSEPVLDFTTLLNPIEGENPSGRASATMEPTIKLKKRGAKLKSLRRAIGHAI